MHFSDRNSDDGTGTEAWHLDTLRDPTVSPPLGVHGDENSRAHISSPNRYQIDDVQFIYGRGTVL
jgi:hypothetical protein